MKIDHTKIKNISINMNNFTWNADTHDILLTRDLKSDLGFSVKLIEISEEKMLKDLTLANDLLKKFRIAE
jgi:hypothetical protein